MEIDFFWLLKSLYVVNRQINGKWSFIMKIYKKFGILIK